MLITILNILHDLKEWINPQTIINTGGLALICFIIFAETGLMVGFFLPGDSLLFLAGFSASGISEKTGKPILDENIFVILLACIACAVVGNLVGYAFGAYTGPKLFKRDDSLLFKKKYLDMTQSFYDKHGGMALIGGRFVPIIRTFVPILAGAIKLDFKKFLLLNVVGAIAWVSSMILIGFFLGKAFPGLAKYLDFIVIGLILITIIPVIRTFMKERKSGKEKAGSKGV